MGAGPGPILVDCHAESLPLMVAVTAPKFQIRALADVNVPEGRVTVVAGTAHHHVHAADFPGKEHPVAVEGQKGVFQLVEGFKILRPCHADGGPVIAVAPRDVVFALHGGDARVVAVFVHRDLAVRTDKVNRLVVDLPMNAVFAAPGKQIHADGTAVAAENACKAAAKGNDRRVKYAVGALVAVAADNRIA